MNPLDVRGIDEFGLVVVQMLYWLGEWESSPVTTAIRVAAALGSPPGITWRVTEDA